jgi:hypothetical protein
MSIKLKRKVFSNTMNEKLRQLYEKIQEAEKLRQEMCKECGRVFCAECPLSDKGYKGASEDVCDLIEDLAHRMDLIIKRLSQVKPVSE